MKSQLNTVSITLLASCHFALFFFSRQLVSPTLGESPDIPAKSSVVWTHVQLSLCENTRDAIEEDCSSCISSVDLFFQKKNKKIYI